ncbi:MAG TPA: NAD(P)-binding protein [Pseudolabrys sp.]|jgi:salicylate hydroxylase/6-hydroxynicotinate 3-monooxygenase
MKRNFSVAVVGAGMGGLAVAATLRRVGIEVQVYE